jgi:hypothetical protein
MAKTKFLCPPPAATGSATFSDNLVGYQVVDGGGLTQGNFKFTSASFEKVSRSFYVGVFSQPYTLENLKIDSIEQSKLLVEKNFQVVPNFDLSQVTSFSLYGSFSKRVSSSITKIISNFPAALQVDFKNFSQFTGNTAFNIIYDSVENETSFDVNISLIKNPFDIDYSINATSNLATRPIKVSEYRNLTVNYEKFSLYVTNLNTQYKVIDFTPSTFISAGTLSFIVEGNPFSSQTATTDTLIIKPNDEKTEEIFNTNFDYVEKYILNRESFPLYTSVYEYPEYDDNGVLNTFSQKLSWGVDGLWNLDIFSNNFETYLQDLSNITENIDSYRTNLISRFLTSGSIKEFDTNDQKVEKVLQLYGRSFDETKKFIDSLAYMTSVNYKIGNDIPSQLLVNLANTLGIDTKISPISNDSLMNSIFTTAKEQIYSGQAVQKTPQELNYQFYRNLILNTSYLFRSKGTRKSIEYIMRFIGAPEQLIEFNEYIYLADSKIPIEDFYAQYGTVSGGTKFFTNPTLDSNNTFKIIGVTYTGFTTDGFIQSTVIDETDYPINLISGYPEVPSFNSDFFFQKGSGWFEVTPQHRSEEVVDFELSDFTVSPSIVRTKLKPFSYGKEYLDRFENFQYMDLGYNLYREVDNKKSWRTDEVGNRKYTNGLGATNYETSDERLVINSKNMELYLNMGQGITYDVWNTSVLYNYPIPNSGLSGNYPSPGLNDWTIINPKPKEKTFFEFAQTFYNNMINVRNRQTISDGKTGGYPTLQSIFWKYLQSQQTVNIPTNNYTYQKMIDYTLGLGDYWVRLVEQFVPATTLWMTGQKMDNSAFHRQKVVWRRQRGCTFIESFCPPCEYNGEPFTYDCIDQTTTCSVPSFNPAILLNIKINELIASSGYTTTQCNFSTILSDWYVDLRLKDILTNTEQSLILEKFYTGYGQNASDLTTGLPLTYYDVLNAINDKLELLYQDGLNYYLSGSNLIISNSSCYDNFNNKQIKLYIGLDVQINCG